MGHARRRIRYEPRQGLAAIAPKAWGAFFDFLDFGSPVDAAKFETEGDYAVVEVVGPLCKGESWCGDSYDAIRDRAKAAFDSDAPKVCLRIDSPGGDWAGCLELSRDLRAMARSFGKPLVAFTDGECCSAAYAIASAAEEIVATPQAFVGSVGVWSAHVDETAWDQAMGRKVTIVASAENKADWSPHVALSEDAYKRLVEQVQAQAQVFFALVAEHRARDAAPVIALRGASVFGQAGIDAGLSDRLVSSWSAFVSGDETPEETAMLPKGQASKYDEALGALKRAAEGDDEDAKKAKKALAAIEEPSEDEKKKKDEEDKAKAAKAAADEDEKKKKDEEVKALAASNLELARKVQALESEATARAAREAAQVEASARASLFAKRPDFGPEVKAALEKLPIAELEKAVQTFPRVVADPSAAAAAQLAAPAGGERVPTGGAHSLRLTEAEAKILRETDPDRKVEVETRARAQGSMLQMPKKILSVEEARARLAELDKEAV